MSLPDRKGWKKDLARYLEIDERRSLGQLASVVVPYLGVWVLAAIVQPSAPLAVALGLVATVFLVRMYSFFHDLTHNSMFESRAANGRFGHLLGFLLFTPYRWWQRQHSLHHAHAGNLDRRGPGEIHTMTVAEYERASRVRRLYYRAYRNPLLMLLVGPSLVFLFERRFPQRGMSRRILLGVLLTNLALAGWAIGWSALVGLGTYLLIQGTTLVAGGAVAAWMLYVQHQYEETYFQRSGEWRFELAALQGSSYLRLPRALTWVVGNANYHHVHHLSARIPNYRLRAAHEEQAMFAGTPVVTLRSGIGALRLKLWDEGRGCLVRLRRKDVLAGTEDPAAKRSRQPMATTKARAPMKRIAPLLLLAAALVLAACGGKTLDTSNVEKDLQEHASQGGGAKATAECPSEVEDVEEGKTYDCTITFGGNENNEQTVQMKIAANDESVFANEKLVNDEIQIRQIVAQVDANPPLICEQVTEEILEQLGGEECPQRAEEEDDGEPANIKSIEVEGDTATMVTDESTTTFERAEGGGWVVTAVE